MAEEVIWKEVASEIARLGLKQGSLPRESGAISWTHDQVVALLPHFPNGGELALYIWGSNSRAESARAKELGWKPKGPTFYDQLAEDVAAVVTSIRSSVKEA